MSDGAEQGKEHDDMLVPLPDSHSVLRPHPNEE